MAETPAAPALKQMRDLADDVKLLGGELQDTGSQLQRFLSKEVKQHPYRTMLVAFGAGYVVAGGLASSLTRHMIRLALRSAAPSLVAAALMKVESPEDEKEDGASNGQRKATSNKEKDK